MLRQGLMHRSKQSTANKVLLDYLVGKREQLV
jgi:hypothetical protein